MPSRDRVVLTVIIPVYNGMPYLVETLDSVLNQQKPDFEVLVIDDGSADDSLDYLLLLTDPRVRVIHQQNSGLCSAMNRGIEEATAPIIARLDQDDISRVDRFEQQYDYLVHHPEVDCVFSITHKFGRKRKWDNQDKFVQLLANPDSKPYLPLVDGTHLHTTLMAKRDALLSVGGYREVYYPSDDYDLALRLAEKYNLCVMPQALVFYRFHADANTYANFGKMQWSSRWAYDSAVRRAEGLPERSLQEFMRQITESPLRYFDFKRQSMADYYIRRSGQYYLDGQYLRMGLDLLIGGVLRPKHIFDRLLNVAKNRLRQWEIAQPESDSSRRKHGVEPHS